MAKKTLRLRVKTGEKDGTNFWNDCGVVFVNTDDEGNITSVSVKHNMFPDGDGTGMPLYIRDDRVDDLAERVMKLTGEKTKTDAVRKALMAQLEAAANEKPLLERIQPILRRVKSVGEKDPDFDMKKYTDEMWGDI